MDFIFASLKKLKKCGFDFVQTWNLKKPKKHEFFFASLKSSKNIDTIFCQLKSSKNMNSNCLQAQ